MLIENVGLNSKLKYNLKENMIGVNIGGGGGIITANHLNHPPMSKY